MRFRRTPRRSLLISLTPLVDVMLILLVFFMVTSNFLNLNMLPILRKSTEAGAGDGRPNTVDQRELGASGGRVILVRLAADGSMHIGGRSRDHTEFIAVLSSRLNADPEMPVLVMPSGGATTQDLVRLLDTVSAAGGQDVRIVRLGPAT